MRRRRTAPHRRRRGNILVLSAVFMIVMGALLAFAIDVGYLYTARAELQRSADAAALAAAAELIDEQSVSDSLLIQQMISSARAKAVQYAASNPVCSKPPFVDANYTNRLDGDVLVGYVSDFADPTGSVAYSNLSAVNAVTVRVRRVADRNEEVPLFFAPILGYERAPLQAEATAAFLSSIRGFRSRSDGGNHDILPLALDEETWNAMLAGNAPDDWSWDAENLQVNAGSDGIREINLYPEGTGSPGNRGTVDIGNANNSTSDIARQIVDGVTDADLEYHGGELKLDDNGELSLNGDTGVSAGFKSALESIIGDPRVIPIFREVEEPGNNAMYTIVKFVGIRILDVNLTGAQTKKRVIIQPAAVVTQGMIPSGTQGTSQLLYSPVCLVY
jgi:Flp pilus assembly protein TadG